MTTKRKKPLKTSFELPKDLTELLIQKIEGLRPSVKADYLKSVFLSKYVSKSTASPLVRRNAAIRKWLAVEMDNDATSDRLLITPAEYNILPRVSFAAFTEWCREYIRDIIGDTPPIEALIGAFSGGASTSRSRTQSQPSSKYLGKAHATLEGLESFALLSDELPSWLGVENWVQPDLVLGNVMFTVPKKTDIDRVACKEPDLNMFIQKGIGDFFRKRLRRVRINLNDQSINRSLAQRGSLTGELATLDLSNASDSVTGELVALLLPETWYTLLDSVRCRVTIINGEEHRNHMFSSMGNGFTFELESLLFYVLTRATAFFTGRRGVVSIYGDDIICPTDLSRDLIWVLQWFGFAVNTDKSFWEGPFRESCGGHYWNGTDITPFYIKGPIESMDSLIDVANKLRKWAEIPGLSILDPDVEPIWFWLKGLIPSYLWGGENLSFKYQLVSNDIPVLRLSEKKKKRDAGTGGYFHWLNTTWERTRFIEEGVKTSTYTQPANEPLELKKVRKPTVPRLSAHFLKEVSG
jgi:hypothetical protein